MNDEQKQKKKRQRQTREPRIHPRAEIRIVEDIRKQDLVIIDKYFACNRFGLHLFDFNYFSRSKMAKCSNGETCEFEKIRKFLASYNDHDSLPKDIWKLVLPFLSPGPLWRKSFDVCASEEEVHKSIQCFLCCLHRNGKIQWVEKFGVDLRDRELLFPVYMDEEGEFESLFDLYEDDLYEDDIINQLIREIDQHSLCPGPLQLPIFNFN